MIEIKDQAKDEYELVKLQPEDTTNVIMTASGGQTRRFRFPQEIVNDSLMRLRAVITPSASGNAALVNMIFKDTIGMINNLHYYYNNSNALRLCEIREFQNYMKVVLKASISIGEFLALPVHGHVSNTTESITTDIPSRGGAGAFLQKSNIGNQPTIVSPNLTHPERYYLTFTSATPAIAINGTAMVTTNPQYFSLPGYDSWRPDTLITNLNAANATVVPNFVNLPDVAYLEPQYVEFSKADDTDVFTANVATPVIHLDFPMSLLKGTWFCSNQDVSHSKERILDLTFGSYNNVGVARSCNPTGTLYGANDVAAGYLAIPSLRAADTTLAGCTISELAIYYAVQKNPLKRLEAEERRINGFNMYFDYCSLFERSFSTSTSQTVDFKINLNDGLRLKRIYVGCFNGSEALGYRYDMNQSRDIKIKTYQTRLDSKYLQQEVLTMLNNDDKTYSKKWLKDSVLDMSDSVYKYNWVHVDCFGDERPIHEQDNFLPSGMSLGDGKDHIYTFYAKTTISGAYRYYCYYITQKVIMIKGDLIDIK